MFSSTLSATWRPRRMSAAARRSSMRPLTQDPMNARWISVPARSCTVLVLAARAEPGSTTCGASELRSTVASSTYSASGSL